MGDTPKILSADEMKQWYGVFYAQGGGARLDRSNVPRAVWSLLPYAEFWGIADDWTREILVKQAPPEVYRNLKEVFAAFEDELEAWLAGPDADILPPSDEYIAFSAMTMAADYL